MSSLHEGGGVRWWPRKKAELIHSILERLDCWLWNKGLIEENDHITYSLVEENDRENLTYFHILISSENGLWRDMIPWPRTCPTSVYWQTLDEKDSWTQHLQNPNNENINGRVIYWSALSLSLSCTGNAQCEVRNESRLNKMVWWTERWSCCRTGRAEQWSVCGLLPDAYIHSWMVWRRMLWLVAVRMLFWGFWVRIWL